MSANAVPLIGVSACRQQVGKNASHTVGDKYVEAAGYAGIPLILPARDVGSDPLALLSILNGIVFTGSPSNVEPHHYNGAASVAGTRHDQARDRLTLPLLRAAIAAGVPVLCICRGFQELNVALGGSLHQRVQELPGYLDHREPQDAPLEEQYGPRHLVRTEAGGLFERFGLPEQFEVNSLHSQGIDRLAPGLRVEARAPDGLIEAVSVEHSQAFAFGVQWHPEWQVLDNPNYLKIFQAFGEACRQRAARRNQR